MPTQPSISRLEKAIQVAAVAHARQKRKGTDIPYIVHPISVGFLLMEAGCPEDVAIAGILHDTLEDTDLRVEEIREEFGARVASIVQACSEPDRGATWEARKRHTHEFLLGAPAEVRLVSCADKLHNVRSMALDFASQGDSVWRRFKRGHAEQAWYYRGLVRALCRPPLPIPGTSLFHAFRDEVEKLFGLE